MSGVTPDRVKKVPTLFGKNGAFSPWFAGIAGSVIVYFRILHLDNPPSVFLSAPIKAAPVLLLFALTGQLVHESLNPGAYSEYAKRVGRGLLCSAAGDVFLDFESAYGHDTLFIAGLLSFLVGHIFYITAFSAGMRLTDLPQYYHAIGAISLYAIGLFGYLYAFLPMPLVGPVFIYASVIATMAITSICRPLPSGSKGTSLATTWSKYSGIAGALIFVVSDSVLAVNKVRQRHLRTGAAVGPAGVTIATEDVASGGTCVVAWSAMEVRQHVGTQPALSVDSPTPGSHADTTRPSRESCRASSQFAFPVAAGKDIVMATYYAGQIGITLSAWGAKEVVRDATQPAPAPAGAAKDKGKRAKKAD